MSRKQHVTLNVQARSVFLKLATSFAENSASAFGMDHSDALALTLATEEIFTYLCKLGPDGRDLEIHCVGGGYYVEVEFSFDAQDFNIRSFNLTATASLNNETSFEETGLLIASRMVDRFDFSAVDGKRHRLTLTKEKAYPALADIDVPEIQNLANFNFTIPDADELKLFAHLVHRHYNRQILPPFLSFPGKVADMVASGDYQATVACHENGQIAGGILWNMTTPTVAACYGPYVFGSNTGTRADMATGLVDRCIEKVARTEAVGLINRYPSRDLPEEYFEKLGALQYGTGQQPEEELPVFYRELIEDSGATVWCHPELVGFLSAEFQRLCLARQILLVRSQGETRAAYSVLSSEFDRPNRQVALNPILSGADAEENLARHVEVLRKEGLTSILFQMDLGKPWQSDFLPALLKNGFEPRTILPHAGHRDLVIFQLKAGDLLG